MDNPPGIIELLSQAALQEFIFARETLDENDLVLRQKHIHGISPALVAAQIKARRKAKDKLPTWYQTRGIVYPPGTNLEQSSSEATARFKTEVAKEIQAPLHSLCDLTGGFGVDTYFFSTCFKEIDYVDVDTALVNIARHNHQKLGVDHISYHQRTAEDFLNNTRGYYDFLFVDPSRRDKLQRKVFQLADCEPDVVRLQENWFEKCDYVLIKASPLLDIHQGLSQLKKALSVFVVSVENEVRELLFLCSKNAVTDPVIHALDLAGEAGTNQLIRPSASRFSFQPNEEASATATFSGPLKYIYEPRSAILKAGAFKLVGERFQLAKLHPNTHFYTSTDLVPAFPGRVFVLDELVKMDKALAGKYPRGQANIIARNYPLTVEEIKKKTGLVEGGHRYLLCFTGEDRKWVAVASRIV